jgi:hypothetical protein
MKLTVAALVLFSVLMAVGNVSVHAVSGTYWFQVGVFSSRNVSSTGGSVEIRVLSPQRFNDAYAGLAYWVGITFQNRAFIQVGYGTGNVGFYFSGNAAEEFWQYFPPGYATNPLAPGAFGGSSGRMLLNDTWVKFTLARLNGTIWGAFVNDELLGSVDLQATVGNAPYAKAEVAGASSFSNRLGPVEFRNLAYRDTNLVWHNVESAVSYCCTATVAGLTISSAESPYGIMPIGYESNHWLAGSCLPSINCIRENGVYLWPWNHVIITSDLTGKTLKDYVIKGNTYTISALDIGPNSTVFVSSTERFVFSNFIINDNPTANCTTYCRLNVSFDRHITAHYKRQYYVNVTSEFGTVEGGGWYDAGSKAALNVSPKVVGDSGPWELFRVKKVFQGWSCSSCTTDSVLVNSPLRVEAVWGVDYGPLTMMMMTPIVVLGVTVLAIMMRRRLRNTHGTD